jgi:hypothetical protein
MLIPNHGNNRGILLEITAINSHSTILRVTSEDGVMVTLPPGDKVTFPVFLAEGLQLVCREDYIQDGKMKIPLKSFISIDKDAFSIY